MTTYESITLTRDCEAVQIPSGYAVSLPAGTMVRVTQSLGGAYTVVTDGGTMVRIGAKDADALGMEVGEAPATPPEAESDLEKTVWDQLRTVYDPEIPVNVVELGLVYECALTPLPKGGHSAYVRMTLTAPGCGMGPILVAEAEQKLRALPALEDVHVELVLDPPWHPGLMSEAARLELGFF